MDCRSFSAPKPGEAGSAFQVMGVMVDITDRKELERRLIEVAELERRRIGQDLHDDVCQRLAAAYLKTGVLQSSLNRASLPQAHLASDVGQELAEATDIARRYAKGLAPVAVGPGALPQALNDLAEFLRRAFGVRCECACETVEGLINAEDAAQVYRIAQELATNAAKHSKGTWISVSLRPDIEALKLEVSHDGATFDPRREPKSRGMGIRIVQQRVDALDATLTYEPLTGGGTTAVCEIPFSNSNT
jgi:signal transduction histidine kinase